MSADDHRSGHDTTGCGCCAGRTAGVPEQVWNRPGLSAVAYRIGTHARFKESLLARLSSEDLPALQDLRTRDDDDFVIALLDAWASVADVLTFYQERIANESYLRTATETRSLYHMAALIGYRPLPGVAAAAYLAFDLETAKGAPDRADIAAGTKVQSIPGQGEKPQVFETVETIEAQPRWNALHPRGSQPQDLSTAMESALIQGVKTNAKVGDNLLIVSNSATPVWDFKQITKVTADAGKGTTAIDFIDEPQPPAPFPLPVLEMQPFLLKPVKLTAGLVTTHIRQAMWPLANLKAQAKIQRWPLKSLRKNLKVQRTPIDLPRKTGIFAFVGQAAVFGHNAPKWKSLPAAQRYGEKVKDTDGNDVTVTALYPDNWDQSPPTLEDEDAGAGYVYQDTTYKEIAAGSWVVLDKPSTSPCLYQVDAVADVSRSGFAMSAKVTRLTLDSSDDFSKFDVRSTSVYLAAAEPLALAQLPLTADIPESAEKNTLVLEELDLELEAGRKVIITGERSDLDGVTESELLTIDTADVIDGYTRLKFIKAIEHTYKRDTVTLNANVALATHGETTSEAIGSGTGTLGFQRFPLRQPPLTHIASSNPSGADPTLEIRVDDLLWEAVPSLYRRGPDERVYVIHTTDEGETSVQFGDGVTGSRLPSGDENVRADYRKGMGEEGLVRSGQLELLLTKPLGVRSVTNPLPAAGAQNREGLEEIRSNAPLTIKTLDRLVSLQDYADFARAFAGISKALATWTWDGIRKGVFITVAGPDGAAIDPAMPTFGNLTAALQQSGDPLVPIALASYHPAFFLLEAGIQVPKAHDPEQVLADVETALRSHFGFAARQFGQPVRRSEVVAAVHQTPGVEALDMDFFYRTDATHDGTDTVEKELAVRLDAAVPSAGDREPLAAELLILDPRPVMLRVLS